MTPVEGRSLLRGGILLLTLAVLRLGLAHVRTPGGFLPEGGTELEVLLSESREVQSAEARRSAPMGPGETLDPNRCDEEDFDRLPGVGPATAQALVLDREENGGFYGPDDLLRVAGIGPAKLSRIRPFLDFSGGMPLELRRGASRGGEPSIEGGGWPDRGESPGGRGSPSVRRPVDLNRAPSEELETLPGIGPALAERIIESRMKDGPFRAADDLLRVPGIGPSTLLKIRSLVIPKG
jgi:competence ComEA-like helix-hairpin-helix protein